MSVSHSVLQRRLIRTLILTQKGAPLASGQSSERGVSLLECLVAIAIIILTTTLILPPLFVAAATRVQNRRAEQALQIAQGEIDRVQVLVVRGIHTTDRLPAAVGGGTTRLNDTPPPTAVSRQQIDSIKSGCSTYNDEQIPVATALRIDIDGDCQADYLMQSFRTSGTTRPGEDKPTDFEVGVRVYAALGDDLSLSRTLQGEQASLKLTSGQGNQRTRPLAVLFSPISWSEKSSTLCSYHGGC